MAIMKALHRKASPYNALQASYRRALSASVVAHARYLAVQGEKNCSDRLIHEQRAAWQAMEARKNALQAHLIATAPQIRNSTLGKMI